MHNEKERLERYKIQLLDIIHEQLPECKVYLFGSRARKTNQAGADFDLALDSGSSIDLQTIVKIYNKIEDTTIPLMVDLVDLHAASEKLINEVKRDGVLWKK